MHIKHHTWDSYMYNHLAYAWGNKKLNKLEILKIKDLKTANRDRKKSNQTRQ